MTPADLKSFGAQIQKLMNGHPLTRHESYAMFSEVLRNRQPDLQQGAFLAALTAKGETADEIAGALHAIDELDTVHVRLHTQTPVVENCGTGMDEIKTFNVSTAAGIIAAACGVPIARHGARALTSVCGTVDIAEALGIDVECVPETVADSIHQVGIGLFNGMSSTVHPAALGRILSQIRFGSTLNIAASLANPARPTHAVRGVYARPLVDRVAAVMQQIGYTRGMVCHGTDHESGKSMDELSVTGPTFIREFFPDGRATTYTLDPADAGIGPTRLADILSTGSLDAEKVRFVRVIAGRGPVACMDFACLNAAAVLYIAGKVSDLKVGVDQARSCLQTGGALEKLRKWVQAQNDNPAAGLATFERVLQLAGVAG